LQHPPCLNKRHYLIPDSKQIMEIQKTHLVGFLVIAIVAALASVMMLWVTVNGLGVSPDSTVYVETAKSLLAGNGFSTRSEPMTHYPPVYPLLLAMAGLLGPDIPQAGRLLHAFLYAANAILFGLSIYVCTRRDTVATACAFLIYFSSEAIVSAHSYAWSESPFITFSLAAFILFSLHIASPRMPLILVASSALGLAIATRYLGIALLPPMLVGLLLFGNRSLTHRITDILIATSVASVPVAVWLIRNIMTAHTATNRSFAVHPVGTDHMKALIITLHDFVLPAPIPGWMKAINLMTLTGALLLALAIMRRQRYIKLNTNSVSMIFTWLGILFALVYVVLVFVSISFFDAHTPLDRRISLPVFVLLTVAAISLAWSLSHGLQKPIIWWSFILCVLVSVGVNGIPTAKAVIHMHTNGIGYNSRPWNESMTLSLVKSFGKTVIIYSNGPDVIRFKTERDAIMIPVHTFPGTRNPNWNYKEQLQAMCEECAKGEAIVVYLNGITRRWYLPNENEMNLTCELPILSQTEDGTVYGRNGKGAEKALHLPLFR
jgi:hypothetical protein